MMRPPAFFVLLVMELVLCGDNALGRKGPPDAVSGTQIIYVHGELPLSLAFKGATANPRDMFVSPFTAVEVLGIVADGVELTPKKSGLPQAFDVRTEKLDGPVVYVQTCALLRPENRWLLQTFELARGEPVAGRNFEIPNTAKQLVVTYRISYPSGDADPPQVMRVIIR